MSRQQQKNKCLRLLVRHCSLRKEIMHAWKRWHGKLLKDVFVNPNAFAMAESRLSSINSGEGFVFAAHGQSSFVQPLSGRMLIQRNCGKEVESFGHLQAGARALIGGECIFIYSGSARLVSLEIKLILNKLVGQNPNI